MVQAAARKIIDFKDARPDDRKWYTKLAWIFSEIEKQNKIELIKLRNDVTCAVLNRASDPDKASELLDLLEDIRVDIFNTHFPYLKTKQADNKSSRKEELVNTWKSIFGDPADIETQSRIQATIEEMRKRRKKGNK